MEMTLLAPGFLLLVLAAPVLMFWPRRIRDLPHGLLRAAVILALAVALARPVTLSEGAARHHVVALDLSGSTAASHGELLARVREVAEEEDGGVRRTLLLAAPLPAGERPDGFDRVGVLDAPGDSPLAAMLDAAALAIPRGAPGAVTLLTDGRATSGGWAPAAEALAARGIPVRIVRAPAGNGARPVRLDVVGELRVGHTGRLRVILAGRGDRVDVELVGPGGVLAAAEGIALEGRAVVSLEFEPESAGFLPLTVTVDGRTLATTVAVQDPLRVLYLGSRVRNGAARLGELAGPGFTFVEDGDPDTRHDLVFLDDVPADEVPEEIQRALAAAVTDRGTGLFLSGGRAAFGPGGWQDSPLAELFPVEFVQWEEKRDPSTTLVVIIDTSGSMGGNRVQLAKEVARLAIRRLLPHDKVGIVEFYGAKRWAAPIQPASNSIEIQRALNRLQAGGGTVILPAIEEAFYGLQNVRTRYKHVLVLTDGGVERGSFEPLLRAMAEEGITVSTVLVGPEAHSEFLVNLSNWGKGRFYSVPNRFNLPEVLFKQPASARLPAYRPGEFPLRTRGGAGWWGSVDPESMPPVAGYVEMRARPGATTLVTTERGGHPIVSTWRYGLGRVTTFATEPVGPGTEPWADWDGYGPFLARLLARTAAPATYPFRFSVSRRGDVVTLRAERVGTAEAGPVARLEGGGERFRFRREAPRRFVAEMTLDPAREARILAGISGDRTVRLVSPARADVSEEMLTDPERAIDLVRLAAATGGAVSGPGESLPALAFGGGTAPVALRSLSPWFLALALFLFLGELAWRRRPGGGRIRS